MMGDQMIEWAKGFRVYVEPRLLIILLLGFSSGLPLGLSGSTLTLWMADVGVNLGTIGLFSLVGLPYSLKFIWAPLFDAVRVPVLTPLLGRRRAWLVLTQLALLASIALMGLVNPVAAPAVMAFAALAVAFFSASQDIVIDAYRVERLEDNEQAAGMANFVVAYRIGMLAAGAGAVAVTGIAAGLGYGIEEVWRVAYMVMAALMLVGLVASFLAREPDGPERAPEASGGMVDRINRAVIEPFMDFARKPYWLAILVFVMLFKFGDAFAGAMIPPFALAIGFDKEAYAYVANGVGLPAVLVGGFLGGFLSRLFSMQANLWAAGILQMLSNLVFCWQAWMGADVTALMITIGVENFTGGMGTVIFVACLSSLCTTRQFTATQYALLAALASVGRTVLSASAGYVVLQTGWVLFFIITTIVAVPGLLVLAYLGARQTFRTDPAPAPA